MSKRFKYEAPGPLRKVALTITSPHRWRSKVRPWIFDNESGVRFQLARDEDAVLSQLTERLTKSSHKPDPSTMDTAYDRAVLAIMARRRGYVFDWHRLAGWKQSDWDGWLGSLGHQQ